MAFLASGFIPFVMLSRFFVWFNLFHLLHFGFQVFHSEKLKNNL